MVRTIVLGLALSLALVSGLSVDAAAGGKGGYRKKENPYCSKWVVDVKWKGRKYRLGPFPDYYYAERAADWVRNTYGNCEVSEPYHPCNNNHNNHDDPK